MIQEVLQGDKAGYLHLARGRVHGQERRIFAGGIEREDSAGRQFWRGPLPFRKICHAEAFRARPLPPPESKTANWTYSQRS